jgi:hypothetical protein
MPIQSNFFEDVQLDCQIRCAKLLWHGYESDHPNLNCVINGIGCTLFSKDITLKSYILSAYFSSGANSDSTNNGSALTTAKKLHAAKWRSVLKITEKYQFTFLV